MGRYSKPLNRDLKCLECGDVVYAKYRCRKHYEVARYNAGREEREKFKALRKAARQREKQKYLDKNGVPCLVAFCATKTLHETDLCEPHRNRATSWNLTPEELEAICSYGECQVCGSTESLVIDHEHGRPCEESHRRISAGCGDCFRGLLCTQCNAGLGQFRDDIRRLEGAIQYLKRGLIGISQIK